LPLILCAGTSPQPALSLNNGSVSISGTVNTAYGLVNYAPSFFSGSVDFLCNTTQNATATFKGAGQGLVACTCSLFCCNVIFCAGTVAICDAGTMCVNGTIKNNGSVCTTINCSTTCVQSPVGCFTTLLSTTSCPTNLCATTTVCSKGAIKGDSYLSATHVTGLTTVYAASCLCTPGILIAKGGNNTHCIDAGTQSIRLTATAGIFHTGPNFQDGGDFLVRGNCLQVCVICSTGAAASNKFDGNLCVVGSTCSACFVATSCLISQGTSCFVGAICNTNLLRATCFCQTDSAQTS
jgi:hypothetical protein